MVFQLDTSGKVNEVYWRNGSTQHAANLEWSDLTPFMQGCVEVLFAEWSDSLNEQGQVLLSWRRGVDHVAFSDLAPETLARIMEDCADYQKRNPARESRLHLEGERGAALWRDRQRGTKPLVPYLADDGKVRFQEGVAR